jgi:hypothetical protein
MPASHPADAAFLAVLPAILRHAQIQFRFVRCAHEREDLLQEALAYGLRWARILWVRGKDVRDFPTALAGYAAQAVRNRRRLCGMEKARDALNRATHARLGFRCESLPLGEPPPESELAHALADDARAEIPARVAFRLDFPAWLSTRTARDRAIIRDMLLAARTTDLAARHRVSPARVSQLRREYRADWLAFVGEG